MRYIVCIKCIYAGVHSSSCSYLSIESTTHWDTKGWWNLYLYYWHSWPLASVKKSVLDRDLSFLDPVNYIFLQSVLLHVILEQLQSDYLSDFGLSQPGSYTVAL